MSQGILYITNDHMKHKNAQIRLGINQ